MKYDIFFNGARRSVEFTPPGDESSPMTAIIDGRLIAADVAKISSGVYSILLGGRSLEVTVEEAAEGYLVQVAGSEFLIKIIDPRSWRSRARRKHRAGRPATGGRANARKNRQRAGRARDKT